jgi:benzylsuccinate CoA-transferase BbsF subunit
MSDGNGAWLPLSGVRVLDFTWMVAGPLGTRLLANYGADVLKVESYNRVDRMRETGPHPPDRPWSYNEDGSFNDVNLGKKSMLLNLNIPAGRELARQLAAVSDVVAANFTGNRLDRWGLGFDDLVKVNPNLILVNMPVFESAGPRQRWTGIGTHVNALAGINGISGFPDDPPFGLGPLYPDFSSNPFQAMAAVLAALIDRDRGGGSQFIELSQYESTAALLGPSILQYTTTGEHPPRMGNHSDRACPHNVYPAAGEDRWIAIAVSTDAEWTALCRTLGHNDWLTDDRFATIDQRFAQEQALDDAIAAETPRWESHDLADRLQQAGVPAAPVNTLPDLLADPWHREQYFTDLDSPEGAVFTTHPEPLRPFGAKHPVRRSPMMGEHTDEVLQSLLGLKQDEINALYTSGALG